MASGSIMSSAAGKPITDAMLIDNLPKEINEMKINDDKEGKTISYMAERDVGQGSFGIVFQAKCLETGEAVAIKKVLQDKRYKNRELQTMRLLDHPSIVSLKALLLFDHRKG